MRQTIAVDFDGVIHGYSKGWQDGSIYDPPFPHAKEALGQLLSEGFDVLICSPRCHDKTVRGVLAPNQVAEIEAYLKKWEIPYSRIHKDGGMPLCSALIDDRAVQFKGVWEHTIADLKELLSRKAK